MKRLLTVLGTLVLLAVLGIGGFGSYVMYKAKAFDASSEAYVRVNVPVIAATWSKQALLERASPQLLKEIRKHPGRIERMFDRLSALGPMKRFGGIEGGSSVAYNLPNDKSTTAAYAIQAVFAHGKAEIKVRLILQRGHWKFLNFDVTAPASLQANPGETTV